MTIPYGNPIGDLNMGSAGAGTVTVGGWAIDPDDPTAAVTIHVYVGGPYTNTAAQGFNIGAASLTRTDVGAVYPAAGSNHGYSTTVTTTKRGTQTVYVYAINKAGTGDNVLLGTRTVTIQ